MARGGPSDREIGRAALAKASWRLLPLFCLGYGVAYMDRVNISFAALQMNQDLHFSAAVYGLGAGLFFLSYAASEVPANLMLLRFGARRWIASIMLAWGALAVGMMFVRTPMQFYLMRLLLGAAEAGFFPGVLFYLTRWFPTEYRGRAISRFYVALPLSSVVMGAIAGTLLGQGGRLGLAGWQWLFLVEGLPAVGLSLVFLVTLPEGPAVARWLTPDERGWIADRLAADEATMGGPDNRRLGEILTDRRVWLLGICNLLILGAGYAFTLSAPAVLQAASHLDAGAIGALVAVGGLLGAPAMLLIAWDSDRRRERHWHVVVPVAMAAAGFIVIGTATASWMALGAYLVIAVCLTAVQGVFWSLPGDVLQGRSAAVGVAAILGIGQVGSFLFPWAFGLARDITGGYQAGLLGLAAPFVAAAAIVLVVRRVGRSNPVPAARLTVV